jgi:hypothetical protein
MSTITVEPRWVVVSVEIPPEPPPVSAQCADGIDNDGDAKIDFPADPGCTSASDNDEFNAPPPPPAQCADGVDNDGDSLVDLADPGCSSATDNDETNAAPPPTNTANVWVDANGGTCVRQITATNYSDAQACGSFAAAYTAAATGDTVGVTGNLGIQKFAGGYQSTQGPGTKTLTFRGTFTNAGPAKSQVYTNSVRQIHFGSPNLTFDGINATAAGGTTVSAVFENGGEPFVFRNGAIGDVVDEKGALVTGAGIVFDNAYLHDVQIVTDGVHLECIWAGVPEGMIIRNSRFERCDVMDLFFVYPDYWSPLPAPYGNVTLDGNYFGSPPFGYSVYIGKNGF